MIIKPGFIEPVDKVIVAVKSLLYTKKYLEFSVGSGKSVLPVELLCLFKSSLVTAAINIYTMLPLSFVGSCRIAAKKMELLQQMKDDK